MKFKCGIIGLPNVGKSTLFNKLTDASVKAENFPFCTIKANRGLLTIRDNRLFQLSKLLKITHVVYGNIELLDIAGLIEGSSQGEGLGNTFLSDISEVDILCHVVRCFNNANIYHVNNEINPEKDIKIVNDELIFSDIEFCESILISLQKNVCCNNNDFKILQTLKKCLIYLDNGVMLHNIAFTVEEKNIIKYYKFLTYKPVIYLANIDSHDNHISKCYLLKLSDIASNANIPYLSMCFLLQEKFQQLKIHKKTLSSNMMLSKNFKKYDEYFSFVKKIYEVLQLKTFFTINTKEARAWVVSKDTAAIQAANMIHSDFKKYFIRVQVLNYNDFIIFQGWKNAKKLGKIRSEGKNYLINDGDILRFLI